MKINNIKLKVFSAVFFMMSTVNVLANDVPTANGIPTVPGDEGNDNVASIDQTMIWLLIAGIFVALYFLQTKRVVKTDK
jgi:hypothetical protein